MQTPEFRKLEFEMTEDGICILTFNIPEKLNALNADCHEDLHTFVDFLESTPEARVGIVTGAGPKSFTRATMCPASITARVTSGSRPTV